ncbi:alpha/beta fold hydrolase [Pediococcus acidilactici]|nr:alpha/beta hydrolase [Pediococcus acidilactici]
MGDALKQLNSRIQVEVMSNVGHIPMAEEPAQFNQLVLRFL